MPQGDWHVIAPDWRGFGLSDYTQSDTYWFPDYLADLDAMLLIIRRRHRSTCWATAWAPTCGPVCGRAPGAHPQASSTWKASA
jgi:pimeloyl-ACP methyl ester carboxylesterase